MKEDRWKKLLLGTETQNPRRPSYLTRSSLQIRGLDKLRNDFTGLSPPSKAKRINRVWISRWTVFVSQADLYSFREMSAEFRERISHHFKELWTKDHSVSPFSWRLAGWVASAFYAYPLKFTDMYKFSITFKPLRSNRKRNYIKSVKIM